jgi:hypothetical protein
MTHVLLLQTYKDSGASSYLIKDTDMTNAVTKVLELLTRRPDVEVTKISLELIDE